MDNKLNFIGALAVAGSIIYAANLITDASNRRDTARLLQMCSDIKFEELNRYSPQVWFGCRRWFDSAVMADTLREFMPLGALDEIQTPSAIPEVPPEAFLD